MTRRRRYLVLNEVMASREEGFADTLAERWAIGNEPARYSDEEAGEFLTAAQFLDTIDPATLVKRLRKARIGFPAELTFDPYRLGRHLLRRWPDETFRDTLRTQVMEVDWALLARLRRKGRVEGLLWLADRVGPPVAVATMRRFGMTDLIRPMLEAFSPQLHERYRALLQVGKALMHRYIHEPEPARKPSPWEQQKLLQRIRLRDLQVRAMRKSLYALRRHRRAMLARLRGSERRIQQPALEALAVELQEIRLARAEAERQHAAALQEQAERYRREIARLKEELARVREDGGAAMAIRRAWLGAEGKG